MTDDVPMSPGKALAFVVGSLIFIIALGFGMACGLLSLVQHLAPCSCTVSMEAGVR